MGDQPAKHGHQHVADGPDPIPVIETPGGSHEMAEWALFVSTTNWAAADPTVLDFGLANGGFDTGPPTFAVNADANPEINKSGVYTIDAYVVSPAVDGSGTVRTQVKLGIARLAGPTPSGIHGWSTGVVFDVISTYFVSGQPLTDSVNPHFHDFVSWDDGDFVGTPAEFEITATNFQDGTPVADNPVIVRVLMTRIGDIFA